MCSSDLGGAEREWSLRENSRAFEDILFRPRSAVATSTVDLSTTVLGMKIDVPFIFAPVGSSRMFYPRGEEVAAKVQEVKERRMEWTRKRKAKQRGASQG